MNDARDELIRRAAARGHRAAAEGYFAEKEARERATEFDAVSVDDPNGVGDERYTDELDCTDTREWAAGDVLEELERLRALVAPVAEHWMAERSHVVGFTHEARDALNALATGWTS
jgi:hypothetical protein